MTHEADIRRVYLERRKASTDLRAADYVARVAVLALWVGFLILAFTRI